MLLEQIEYERAALQGDLDAGWTLCQEEYAPEFVQEAVEMLQAQWTETANMAKEKHQTIKVRI